MSYNIDHIEVLHSKDFSVDEDVFYALKGKYEDEAPEINLFEEARVQDGRVYLDDVTWSCSGSGNSEPILKKILSKFDGELDLILTWEGGDSVSGLRLRNHKVTEHDVVMSLGDEI